MAIDLPNDWEARPYQQRFFDYMFEDPPLEDKRAITVYHRRAGKDSMALNFTAMATHMRVGTYWHMLPTLNQGRKVVWDGIDKFGRRMIDQAFPKDLRETTHNGEMQIKFKNGSIWQVVGSDNYDSVVGTNPVGVIMSEYAVADPDAWDFIRPILLENHGWAIFPYTPRGKNHGYDLYKMATTNKKWFCELLTVDDTFDNENNPIMTPEMILEERNSGMAEELIQQEYFCSFEAAIKGAYYAKQMELARIEKRITDVPYNPDYPVETWWDIGLRDSTVIWFMQDLGTKYHAIDFYEMRGEPFTHYLKYVKEKPYVYSRHIGPHDIEQREYTSGKSRLEVADKHGISFEIAPRMTIKDGIDATRGMLGQVWFDATKCDRGIEALKSYRPKYHEDLKTVGITPIHDWASHPADAFRMGGVSPRHDPQWMYDELEYDDRAVI